MITVLRLVDGRHNLDTYVLMRKLIDISILLPEIRIVITAIKHADTQHFLLFRVRCLAAVAASQQA
ncbi:hypothetical protein D3C81_967610 [compost metagenome]